MPQSQMIPARYSFSGMIEDVLSCELAGVGNDFLLVLAYREGSVVFWNVEEKTVSSLFSSSMLQLSDIHIFCFTLCIYLQSLKCFMTSGSINHLRGVCMYFLHRSRR